MPHPNLAHLQAGPETFLVWLEHNILKAAHPKSLTGLAWVKFDPAQGGHPQTGVDLTGNAVDVYQISTQGAGAQDAVRSYICNYMANESRSVDVSNAGDFCFTANMNGCSFGIDGSNPNGSVKVTHANRGGHSGDQLNQLGIAHNGLGGLKVLEPQTYRTMAPRKNMNATTFGIRSGMNWKWYFQSYCYEGKGLYTLYGVFPIL